MQPDDLNLKEQFDLGLSADRCMREPAYAEAVTMTENRLEQEWMNTEPDQTAAREMLWAKMKALEELHRSMVILQSRGEEAKRKLDELNSEPE